MDPIYHVAHFLATLDHLTRTEHHVRMLRVASIAASAVLFILGALSMQFVGLLGVLIGYALSRLFLDNSFRIATLAYHSQLDALQNVNVKRFVMVRSHGRSCAIVQHGEMTAVINNLHPLAARAMRRYRLGQIYNLPQKRKLNLRCSVARGFYFLHCLLRLRLTHILSDQELEQLANFIWMNPGFNLEDEIRVSARRSIQREMQACDSTDHTAVKKQARALPRQLTLSLLPYTIRPSRTRLEKANV